MVSDLHICYVIVCNFALNKSEVNNINLALTLRSVASIVQVKKMKINSSISHNAETSKSWKNRI